MTDNLTALQWEKKNSSTAHNKDKLYTWNDAAPTFLGGFAGVGLNFFPNGNAGVRCFVSLCDWRLPTVAELQTILSGPFPCATSPCVDALFGDTADTEDYWSSTTLADNTAYAWGVFFGTGEVSYGLKTDVNVVRGVRDGL